MYFKDHSGNGVVFLHEKMVSQKHANVHVCEGLTFDPHGGQLPKGSLVWSG